MINAYTAYKKATQYKQCKEMLQDILKGIERKAREKEDCYKTTLQVYLSGRPLKEQEELCTEVIISPLKKIGYDVEVSYAYGFVDIRKITLIIKW